MPNRVNALLRKEFTEQYREKEYLVAVGFSGLSAEETCDLRTDLKGREMEMHVVKNRIARLAFCDLGVENIDLILTGETALVEGQDPVSTARALRDFAKEHKALQLRGAILEKQVLDAEQARSLADMKSREEMIGDIAGAALSGGANLAGALLGPARMVAGCVKSLIEKLESGEEAGEAVEVAAEAG